MEIIHLLIDFGANIKGKNAQGKIALDLAAPKSSVEQALLLREGKKGLGIRFSSKNTSALSPPVSPLDFLFLFLFVSGSGTQERARPSITERGFLCAGYIHLKGHLQATGVLFCFCISKEIIPELSFTLKRLNCCLYPGIST